MNIQKKINTYKKLRWFCRVVVLVATGSSVWANWLHSDKNGFAIAINVMPPLLVLLGYEMSSRIPLWEGPWWHPRRWARPGTMFGITIIGAWLSYWHQHDAFFKYSKDAQTALLLPFAIDGLMIIASVSVMDLSDKLEAFYAWQEAGGVSTYTPPKEKEPTITKPKDREPTKKERIIEYLTRHPEMPVADVATATAADMNYVYAVRAKLIQAREGSLVPA